MRAFDKASVSEPTESACAEPAAAPAGPDAPGRARRLAVALRENLHRRKAQARQRRADQAVRRDEADPSGGLDSIDPREPE